VENIYNILWQIYSDNKYKILSESAWFCRRCDKRIWCFWVRSSNCCSLTKCNAKFHKL